MPQRPQIKLRIKRGPIPWLRIRAAIIFAGWGWNWAVDLCTKDVFEVVN